MNNSHYRVCLLCHLFYPSRQEKLSETKFYVVVCTPHCISFLQKTCTWAVAPTIKLYESGFDIALWAIDFSVLYFAFHRFTDDLNSWHKKVVGKLSGQATRCSGSLESHSIPAACTSLVLVTKANVEGGHTEMPDDCYMCTRRLKTSGVFQSFWKGSGRSNGFLDVHVYYSL